MKFSSEVVINKFNLARHKPPHRQFNALGSTTIKAESQ